MRNFNYSYKSRIINLNIYNEDAYDSYQSEKTIEQPFSKESYYYLKDYIGNNQDVVSSKGTNTQRTEYFHSASLLWHRKWGVQVSSHINTVVRNLINYYDLHARQYDPLLARFASMDTMAEQFSHGAHMYTVIIIL